MQLISQRHSLLVLLIVHCVCTYGQNLYNPNHDFSTKAYLEELDVKGIIQYHGGLGNTSIDNLKDSLWLSRKEDIELVRFLNCYNINDGLAWRDKDLAAIIEKSYRGLPFLKWPERHFKKNKGNFYLFKDDKVWIKVNPIIDFGTRRALGKNNIYNTRGIEIAGTIDSRVSFYTYVSDNQMSMPRYINEQIVAHQFSMPGEFWLKAFKAGETNVSDLANIGSVDFFSTRAFINLKISPSIDLQFGHDKNRLGYGLRSLALSDYSTAYPFLKLETKIGRVKYQNLFTELNDYPNRTTNALIQKKYFASQALSWNIGNDWNLTFFENVIFARPDSTSRSSFELQYLNPVIFYRSVEHSLGSPDNASLGFHLKKDFKKTLKLYAQFYLDDLNFQSLKADVDSQMVRYGLKNHRNYDTYAIWTNKWATQLGLQYYDVAGIENLDLRIESNRVKPYTYSHSDTRQSYSHNHQPLGHPLGANLKESIVELTYKIKRLDIQLRYFRSLQGIDDSFSNWGSDIHKNYFRPGESYENYYYRYEHNYNSTVGRGYENRLDILEFILLCQINHNLIGELSVKERRQKNENSLLSVNDRVITLGIRWNIGRKYFDF